MKKLLSLVALLALAAALPADEATAGLRGAFDPLTNGSSFNNGLANGCQTPALRTVPFGANGGVARIERWYSFTTRSQAVGFESSREIWLARNQSQIGPNIDAGALPGPINPEARQPLLRDPSGLVSYTDPAWSPNGSFLAYIQTDANLSQTAIYVQEYTVSTTASLAGTPIGAPILVLGPTVGVKYRHPDWSPDGTSLVFDSDATGLSVDLYTMTVFPSPSAPVRRTFVDNRAEQNPAWAPDGIRIAYDTNRFGPNVIEILNTSTNVVSLAETNFATVTHSNPDWDAAGNIFYEAPQAEDAQQNPDIWRINPTTQSKCPILLDGRGDGSVSVSTLTNTTIDGISYSTYVFETQAANFGLGIWRGNPVHSCLPPLALGADISPQTINVDNQASSDIILKLTMPAESEAAGYQAVSFNGPREGLRFRRSILPSPVLLGLAPDDDNGDGLADFKDNTGSMYSEVDFNRRPFITRLVSLGIVNQDVLADVTAYSNITGRGFRGFATIHLSSSNLAGSVVKLDQNSPNPFNPRTTIKYATSKAGHVTLRIYNVQGALVKTLADKYVDAGQHEASWDGRNSAGQTVSSGVYYAKAFSTGGTSDVMKMVLSK